jgi:hypothetical protein
MNTWVFLAGILSCCFVLLSVRQNSAHAADVLHPDTACGKFCKDYSFNIFIGLNEKQKKEMTVYLTLSTHFVPVNRESSISSRTVT